MVPWLLAILLALNLALFWWGWQHEVPIEPQIPPLPEALHQIQLLGTGPGPEAATTVQSAESHTPGPGQGATPGTSSPSASVAETMDGQTGPDGDDGVAAPDEGAAPDTPPLVKLLEPPTPDELAAEPPRVYFPDPDPTDDRAAGSGASEGAGHGIESALSATAAAAAAAAAPKAIKKRKPRRRASKPTPDTPVELPLEFP